MGTTFSKGLLVGHEGPNERLRNFLRQRGGKKKNDKSVFAQDRRKRCRRVNGKGEAQKREGVMGKEGGHSYYGIAGIKKLQ